MKKVCYIALLLVGLVLNACSNSESVHVSHTHIEDLDTLSLKKMVLIRSKGLLVTLGTDDESALVNECPAMKVSFDYDFFIGTHEVSCKEMNLDCAAADLPATNVTFFDAVLYANKRSLDEDFDTAYTYSRAVFDSEGHCTNLEGFAYRPEKKAYRLPTEAEWILVAKANWNVFGAWTSENSDYKLHPVCEKADSSSQVCDIAGNAMEWVNDWLGKFRDTMVTNFVGAPDGGALGQRIVKGGSYRNSAESITLYSRGDVYTVTSSTRADYVGFRLAFGAIPGATWMRNDGKVASSRVVPLASSATMRSLFQTYKAKLAFRDENSGNLAYIDYSSGNLSVHEIEDTLDAYHPEISPNGKYVAFCTGLEGVSEKSELYVRDLNATASNLVKLEVLSAAIPRWRVLESGDTVIVYVTDAGSNKEESAFKSSSTWQVSFANGKFGKPQKLFDGAYHGGIGADNSLAVTGAKLLRARVSGHDTVWYGGEQACNASLAKDSSKRTLFLDFGGKIGREYAGGNYGTHERLLVVDSVGNLVQTLAAPAGYSFDHSKWVSNGNFAVATLTNANGTHTKIVLVDLTEGDIVELVEGDELWHPSLWISDERPSVKESFLDSDSAGMYTIAEGTDRSKILRFRMELMWKYRDSAELVVLGSSRSSNGIDASRLSVLGVNLSYFPSDFHDIVQFYERYIDGAFGSLKYVVISLDIDFWNNPEETSFFTKEYESFPGYVYDRNHQYWKNVGGEAIYWATQDAPGIDVYRMVFLSRESSVFAPTIGWGEAEINDSTWMDHFRSGYEASYAAFIKLLKTTQANNQVVVGIIFPQSPEYRNTGSMGRDGLRRSEAVDVIDSLQKLQNVFDNFILMDENKMGFHDYVDSMAQDCDHLNQLGAKQLTARLDSLLKTIKP